MSELETTTQELKAAVVAVAAAAEVLKSPFFAAQLSEALAKAHVQANSPWLDREAAGAYAYCNPTEIDRVAGLGVITRHYRAGTPMFKKSEIDAAIESGRWPKRGAKAA